MAHSKPLQKKKRHSETRSFSPAQLHNDVYYQMASLFKAAHPEKGRKLARQLIEKSVSRPGPRFFYGKLNVN